MCVCVIITVCHQLVVYLTEIMLLRVDFRAEMEVWRRWDGAQQLRQKQRLKRTLGSSAADSAVRNK